MFAPLHGPWPSLEILLSSPSQAGPVSQPGRGQQSQVNKPGLKKKKIGPGYSFVKKTRNFSTPVFLFCLAELECDSRHQDMKPFPKYSHQGLMYSLPMAPGTACRRPLLIICIAVQQGGRSCCRIRIPQGRPRIGKSRLADNKIHGHVFSN
jgi:hypothetical protein